VEGTLSKDMTMLGEHLQTWKLKLSTTKTVSAVFHLNKVCMYLCTLQLKNTVETRAVESESEGFST